MKVNNIAVTGKRLAAAAFTLFFLFAFLTPVFAAVTVPEYKDEYGYVADFADVIKGDTINYINEANVALTDATGAEIIVVTVDFLDGAEIEDYAYSLFNAWAIGSAEKDNGILVLLVIGEENYYALQGAGLEQQFSSSMLDEYLYDFLEEDFAAGDYDAGVRKFFNATLERLERIYGVSLEGNASQPNSSGSTDRGSSGYTPPNPSYQPPVYRTGPRINWALIIVVVIIVAFYLFSRRPRYPRTYGRPYMARRTIFRPIIFGGRRPYHYHPPVGMPRPRPVRSPGTKGGPKPPSGSGSGGGGFSGRTGGGGSSRGGGAGRSSGGFGGFGGFGGSSGGSRPSSGSSGRSSGGFGGGRSSGGFGGGRSGGFGGRSGGGGSSRGGGAGRR